MIMMRKGRERNISKEQYRIIYESKILNGETNEEASKKSGVSISNTTKIIAAFNALGGDLDFIYSIPTAVVNSGKSSIKEYARKVGYPIKDDPIGDEKSDSNNTKVNKDFKPLENDYEFEPVNKKVNTDNINPIYGKSMGIPSNIHDKVNRRGGVVTHYIPDYRRVITPKTVSTNYEYGGIQFSIDESEKTITFKNLDSILDIGDDISCSPGEFNKGNIKTLINYGEALVGIGMFFESFIK